MGATSGSQQDVYSTSATYDSWHTAVVEWTPSMVRFVLDGQIIGTSTAQIPSDPMHWILQTETATDGTITNPDIAGHVLIDWVAVYTPKNGQG
jgi:beta-glucanase (GH16 family)